MTAPVMSPRVALVALDDEGHAALPSSIGGVVVWTERRPCTVGGLPAREYRAPGRLVVIATVARVDEKTGLVAAWVPAVARDGENRTYAAVSAALMASGAMLGTWDVDADGGVVALEKDEGDAAKVAREAWPAAWRAWAEDDVLPDPRRKIEGGAPTGPRMLGVTLA